MFGMLIPKRNTTKINNILIFHCTLWKIVIYLLYGTGLQETFEQEKEKIL